MCSDYELYCRGQRWLVRLLSAVVIVLPAPWASGKAVIRLEPTPSGPYSTSQVVSIDVYIDNIETIALPLQSVQLDFSDIGPGITPPPAVDWVLAPATAANPNLPRPNWTDNSPTPVNVIPPLGTLYVAKFLIRLPSFSGCHKLDVFNRDEPLATHGAQLQFLPTDGNPSVQWRAYHGQLLDGAEGFPILTGTASEACNGVDDDCDGLIDEDFFVEAYNPLVDEIVLVGTGAACVNGVGDCATNGTHQCVGAGLDCVSPPTGFPVGEGPYTALNCYDLHDNDCDGFTDWEDPDCTSPELCDYVDNDNNGIVDDPYPELDLPCTKGEGVCAAKGVFVCSADGTAVECSAQQYPVGIELEGPPNHPNCSDDMDNDCDGRVDLEDPDCQEPEKCDGKDNDGDLLVDENWPSLGQLCEVGVGACQRIGEIECNATQTGVQCGVSPGAPTPEGPGCDCGDTIDNDCDGLTDLDDPDCGAFIFRARAALPRVCDVDSDCASWRRIEFDTLNGGPGALVEAELVAMDSNGAILGTKPVANGDMVHITSRINLTQLQLATTQIDISSPIGRSKWINCTKGPGIDLTSTTCVNYDTDCDNDVDLYDAAVHMLHYPEPIKHHTAVAPIVLLRVTADNGYAKVKAYASPHPHVHVWHPDDSVVIVNQGDRVLMDIAIPEINPATLLLRLDGVNVLQALGVNPATDLPGGPYGGTINLPNGCSADICELIVDSAGSETPAAHSIRMVVESMCCGGHLFSASGAPSPGAAMDGIAGCEVDDGHDIGIAHAFQVKVSAPVDGFVDPAPPVAVAGTVCHGLPLGNTPSGPTQVELNGQSFSTSSAVITAGDGVNTADRYAYAFSASLPETDLLTEFISTGPPGTVDEGSSYLVTTAMDPLLNSASDKRKIGLGPLIAPLPARGNSAVSHGLSLAITDGALTTVVQHAVNALVPVLVQELSNMIHEFQGTKFSVPTNGPCNPVVTVLPNFFPPPIFVPPDINQFVVDVNPQNDHIDVSITVPETRALGGIFGVCEIEGLFGECFIEITVFVYLDVKVKKAVLSFSATEADLIASNAIVPQLEILPQDIEINIQDIGSDVGCWGGVLAQILSFGVFGAVVDIVIEDKIEDKINDFDPSQYLGMIPVPPIPIDFLNIDPIDLGALGVALYLNRTEVEITPAGMAVGLETEFVPKQIDPEVEIMPGLPDTQAVLPQPALPVPALGATLFVSDDAVNQMLNALTRNGYIKTQYEDVRTMPDLLPANCSTLSAPLRGQCLAMKGLSCLGQTGEALATCIATDLLLDQLNIDETTPLIFHGRLDAAPKFYIFRRNNPLEIAAYFRVSQVQVAVIADRDGDGVYIGELGALPSCFGDNPGTQTPCVMWTGCFEMNVALNMHLTATPNGVPEVSSDVINVELSDAMNCGGGTGFPAGLEGLQDVFAGQVFNLINTQVSSIPPLKLDGLDFGNIVNLLNLQVLTHGNQHDAVFEDYFGITADPN